jgi:hypothetical protein
MQLRGIDERYRLPRRKNQPFTPGGLNKIIDAVLHPLAKQDVGYYALDTFFHAIVEQNPRLSAEKFIRYNLPKILDRYTREQTRRQCRIR